MIEDVSLARLLIEHPIERGLEVPARVTHLDDPGVVLVREHNLDLAHLSPHYRPHSHVHLNLLVPTDYVLSDVGARVRCTLNRCMRRIVRFV